jgi:hypothetical protein
MKYYIFTYDGCAYPIAKQLQEEGNVVYITQINDSKDLGVESGINAEEKPEKKKRRLSIYEGVMHKTKPEDMMKMMRAEKNKDDCYVIFDFNNLWKYAEKVLEMGYKNGNFPLESDFEREKNRNAAKNFVKKHYKGIKVAETYKFNKIEDAIQFLNENTDRQFALKSDGNFVKTVVPLTKNNEFAKAELIFQLKRNKSGYEKGFTLEEKIEDPIEVAPQIAFWNGKPIYTTIDIETRMIGPGDVGYQTGGNENIVMATNMEDKINKIAFPPIIYELAKNRKGLFLFDCGILFDKKGQAYFTEFAGNRWGWGGVFSELSMARKNDGRVASNYFESLMKGKNPHQYKFGSTLSIYNISIDGDHAGMYTGGDPIQWDNKANKWFYPYEIKKEMVESEKVDGTKQKDEMHMTVCAGCMEALIAYTTGCGNTFEQAVDCLYDNFVGHVYTSGMYYRSKADMLATDYPTSIKNRLNFLTRNGYISGKFKIEESNHEIEIYSKYISNKLKKY